MKKSLLINLFLLFSLTHFHDVLADTESNGDALLKILAAAPFAQALYRQDADGIFQYTFGALSDGGISFVFDWRW